jgi:glucose-1-phosphate adenylyltransferase
MEHNTLAVVLAGDAGRALSPLTRYRAKTVVRFAGVARLIDFPLANCLNSGLSRVIALTGRGAQGLQRYVVSTWQPAFEQAHGGFLEAIAPADEHESFAEHLPLIDDIDPEVVLVLAGDQLSYIDFRPVLAFHRTHGGDATVVCVRARLSDVAAQRGFLQVDRDYRVSAVDASSLPLGDDAQSCLATMGACVLTKSALAGALPAIEPLDDESSIERELLPMLAGSQRVFAYEFTAAATGGVPYWRDVGTLDAYYQAQRDLLLPTSPIEIDDPRWPLLPDQDAALPTGLRQEPSYFGDEPNLIATDAAIHGKVSRSIIGPGCIIERGAVVEDSVLTHGVIVERSATVTHAVLDEHVHVASRAEVGVDSVLDASRGLTVTSRRIVAAPSFHLISAPPRPHRRAPLLPRRAAERKGSKSLW